jgi:hypothetical protein
MLVGNDPENTPPLGKAAVMLMVCHPKWSFNSQGIGSEEVVEWIG